MAMLERLARVDVMPAGAEGTNADGLRRTADELAMAAI